MIDERLGENRKLKVQRLLKQADIIKGCAKLFLTHPCYKYYVVIKLVVRIT